MSLGYVFLIVFRILSTVFVQNSYIHPDEYFQTTEIIIGDFFSVVHGRPWEFNGNSPLRSVGLLHGIFGIPLHIVNWIFNIYKIKWNPFMLLIIFRIITCAISFITDYSLYKICKILKLKPNKYLLLLSSSYVLIVFGTKTFTNSLELALVSLLLWQVVDSIKISEKVLAAENKIQKMYSHSTLIIDKVLMSRKLHKLPSHNFRHCLEIGTILAIGIFNRPTFLLFAVTPIFYWLSRGFSENYNHFVRIFNIRFLILFLCVLPGVFLLIFIDTFYFEDLTKNNLNWIITPLNFIKYNIKSSNLVEHGIHFRLTHAFINIPLLFNVLIFIFLRRLQLNSLIKIIINRHYHYLPNIHDVNTLMMANVIVPLCLLSVFPHQEPRFLLPLLLPIVFTTSKYFSSHFTKNMKHIIPIWCISNIVGLIFYGYLHQAGIIPMISHIFKEIKYVSNIHIINSHTYSIPVGLLMVPQQLNGSLLYTNRRIKIHDLGSSLDSNILFDTVISISKNISLEERPVIYFALSGPLIKKFEGVKNIPNFIHTKQLFFPHVSIESLRYYLISIKELWHNNKNETFFNILSEFQEIFSLVLYKITVKTE